MPVHPCTPGDTSRSYPGFHKRGRTADYLELHKRVSALRALCNTPQTTKTFFILTLITTYLGNKFNFCSPSRLKRRGPVLARFNHITRLRNQGKTLRIHGPSCTVNDERTAQSVAIVVSKCSFSALCIGIAFCINPYNLSVSRS